MRELSMGVRLEHDAIEQIGDGGVRKMWTIKDVRQVGLRRLSAIQHGTQAKAKGDRVVRHMRGVASVQCVRASGVTPLLFLDIDGVLAPYRKARRLRPKRPGFSARQRHLSPDACGQVNRIVEATCAEVCIVSAWRYYQHNSDITVKLKRAGIEAELTYLPARFDRSRHIEISDYLDAKPTTAWCVIDDDPAGELAGLDTRLIGPDSRVGLTATQSDEAIDALSGIGNK